MGPVVAALLVVGVLGLCFWWRWRSRRQSVDAIQSRSWRSVFLPRRFHSQTREDMDVEGSVTPYPHITQSSRNVPTSLPQAFSQEPMDAVPELNQGEKSGLNNPLSPAASHADSHDGIYSSSQRPIANVLDQQQPRAPRAPPRSVPATYVPDEISEGPHSPTQAPRPTERSHEARTLPSLAENDPTFVERVLAMVVQRIDARLPSEATPSRHDQELPPYTEDVHHL